MKRYSFLVLLLLFLCGCRTHTVYVPVETTRTVLDTDSLNRLIRLMLMHSAKERERETVFVKLTQTYTLNAEGDTVSRETERETQAVRQSESRELYLLSVIDSLSKVKERVDSVEKEVPYPVETVREVNRLSWWQTALMWLGVLSLLVLTIRVWPFKRK